MNTSLSLAEYLEKSRYQLHMSQADFAAALSLSLTAYKRIITNESHQAARCIDMLIRINKLTGNFVFQMAGVDFSNDILLQIVDKLTKLDKSSLNAIYHYVSLFDNSSFVPDQALLQDSMSQLLKHFHKIIKVNLSDDTFVPICVDTCESFPANCFSEWLKSFCASGLLHPDDISDFSACTNLRNLRMITRHYDGAIFFDYRRIVNGKYKRVIMNIIRSSEYQNNNQIVLLYVRDADEK